MIERWEFVMRKWLLLAGLLCMALITPHVARVQGYAIGADISFLGKCEQDGIIFKEHGKPMGALAILHAHHYN